MRKILLILIMILVPAIVYGETLTLSTYYPAPFGSYDRMRLVPRNIEPTCDAGLVGSIYFDENDMKPKLCDTTGSWNPLPGIWGQDGDNISVKHPDVGNTYFVGIGDATPEAILEISGANTGSDLLMLNTDENNDGNALVVKGNGKVGIGEPNPDSYVNKDSIVVIKGTGITDATSGLLVVDGNGRTALFVRDDRRVSIGETGNMDNELEVNGAIDVEVSGRDSVVRFQETNSANWYSMGIDMSDAGKFKINWGGSLGDPDREFSVDQDGDVFISGSLTIQEGMNVGEVQVDWVADATNPGFYATYAP